MAAADRGLARPGGSNGRGALVRHKILLDWRGYARQVLETFSAIKACAALVKGGEEGPPGAIGQD
jgi:hypothetical protein